MPLHRFFPAGAPEFPEGVADPPVPQDKACKAPSAVRLKRPCSRKTAAIYRFEDSEGRSVWGLVFVACHARTPSIIVFLWQRRRGRQAAREGRRQGGRTGVRAGGRAGLRPGTRRATPSLLPSPCFLASCSPVHDEHVTHRSGRGRRPRRPLRPLRAPVGSPALPRGSIATTREKRTSGHHILTNSGRVLGDGAARIRG